MKSSKIKLFCFFCILGFVLNGNGQILKQSSYKLTQTEPIKLTSNAINDILIDDENNVWIGTASSLMKTTDLGADWTIYSRAKDGIGKGGVTALAEKEGTVWIATGFDTATSLGHFPAGGGIGYLLEGDSVWHWFPQPVDPKDEVDYKPTTVTINNLTYDIAFSDSAVWIVSWAGGLRKSIDMGETWEIVTVDGYPFSALDYLTHRTFSVLYDGKALWVGSAGGIHKSIDEGRTWTTFNHRNQPHPISGNFVVALAHQQTEDKDIIWASTIEADDTSEYRAVSKTEDGGYTWSITLEGEFVHNFAVDGPDVYAVTDNGMYKSADYGETWVLFPQIRDEEQDRTIYTMEIYCADVGPAHDLWVGTADGLAMSRNFGWTWTIFRAYQTPGTGGNPETYAYPNPFSPMRHNRFGEDGHVRFNYEISHSTSVTVKVYDFGMNLVRTVASNKQRSVPGNYDEIWDGKNGLGDTVANGVYFYRIEFSDRGPVWGKVIVID